MEPIQLSKPSITDEEVKACERVLRSGWLVSGPEGRAFEEELAAALHRRHAAVVSSGTAALHLALRCLHPAARERPHLLVPAFTFPATANVARWGGMEICLADVAEDSFCLPEATLSGWLASGAGPAMTVHQFGYPAGVPEGPEPQLLISDAACAIGVRQAMRGRCACLSFHPRKVLTTGEGGAVISDDEGLIEEVRLLRAHGLFSRPGEEIMAEEAPGLNYRMPEMAAAIGRVQLRRLPGLIEAHRERALRYREGLLGRLPMQADAPGRIWQTLAVVLPEGTDRPALRRRLREAGIETQIASYALHRLAAFRDVKVVLGDGSTRAPAADDTLPVASRLHDRGLALPLHADLSLHQVDRVCEKLLQVLGS